MCMYVCFNVYMRTTGMLGACRSQTKLSAPLKLKLLVISCQGSARNWTRALWKSTGEPRETCWCNHSTNVAEVANHSVTGFEFHPMKWNPCPRLLGGPEPERLRVTWPRRKPTLLSVKRNTRLKWLLMMFCYTHRPMLHSATLRAAIDDAVDDDQHRNSKLDDVQRVRDLETLFHSYNWTNAQPNSQRLW